ncbi:MAG: type II toxin-antitoxin system VapC family toxin [Spirochaetales bacterium]|nr:type II toxin-antitoxin system VapC family toxin [Spirochaetales bacterium]
MYLLDTHTLIWYLTSDAQLSKKALNAITSLSDVYISSVSLWEIAIKKSINKLDVDVDLADIVIECNKQDINILQLELPHYENVQKLPFFHKDPFDRMIIAQAQAENLIVITRDEKIPLYNVQTLW